MMRRQLVSFLRKSVKLMFTSSISKTIVGMMKEYGSNEKVASFLGWIKGIVWPNGQLLKVCNTVNPTGFDFTLTQLSPTHT